MKMLQKMSGLGLGAVVSISLYSAVALAAMPPHEFACQVQTRIGQDGLLMLQAASREEAAAAAVGISASTNAGTKSTALAVKECIHLPDEQFKDKDFQRFFERTPL